MGKLIKIVIIGNGFGGTYALKELHKFFHNDANVELSLIGEKNYFLFTPLLHEVATGGINAENIIEPIRNVLDCCLKDFYVGKVEFINLKEHTLMIGDKNISYDYLVLAPGADTNFYNITGAEKYSLQLKSLDDAIKIKNRVIRQMDDASNEIDIEKRKRMLRFVIVGGGPTGVELAAELWELIKDNFGKHYQKEIVKDTEVILIQKNGELLTQFSKPMRDKALKVLNKKGIKVILSKAVKQVSVDAVLLDNGTKLETNNVIWVAGIKPATINFNETPEQSKDGRLLVNEYLQLVNHKEVFAIGDIAFFMDKNSAPLPALAQVAEKEAKNVAKNIYSLIKNKPLQLFSYKHTGTLVSLGKWMAIGEVLNFTFSGGITWWVWRTVYLSKLLSWRKKFEVALDWTINIFSSRDISQI